MKKLIAFLKEEDGLELSEYAVMGALDYYRSCSYYCCSGDSYCN